MDNMQLILYIPAFVFFGIAVFCLIQIYFDYKDKG